MVLYMRMAMVMVVGLYTSRVILDALGKMDLGIYTTVGGIVLMFSFLSSAMSTACERFYAREIGRGDMEGLRHIFSMCIVVFAAIAVLAILLSESIGLWLLYRKIDVEGRMTEALWVFHLSVISLFFTIMRAPYMAMITIREKMKVLAYVSFVEVMGGLAIALLIRHSSLNRLVLYSWLMLAVNAAVSVFYWLYCRRFYPESRFRYWWSRTQFREIFGFAFWGMFGSAATVAQNQGINVLLAIFFSPAINTARFMAYKVYASLRQFVDNFIIAFRPQILKSYSEGEKSGFLGLVCQSSKFSFYLMLAISLPFLLEMELILDVWLKDVPDYTVLFARLALVCTLLDVLNTPLNAAMQACGRIRNYQIVTSSLYILILPVSYLFLKLGFQAECVYYITIVMSIVSTAVKLLFTRTYVGLDIAEYAAKVVWPVISVTVLSSLVPLALYLTIDVSFIRFVAVVSTSLISTAVAVFYVGMTSSERRHTSEFVLQKIRRIRYER